MTIRSWRKIIYPFIAVLVVAVFAMSLYETYITTFGPADPPSYMGVPAQPSVLPQEDYHGAYLQLKAGADLHFPSNLVQLLETDTPGVVAPNQLLLEPGRAIDAVLVYQSSIDVDTTQYRVYPVGQDPLPVTAQRAADGKTVRIRPKAGAWPPGSYLVDVPSGGMFDNSRVYYAFGVK